MDPKSLKKAYFGPKKGPKRPQNRVKKERFEASELLKEVQQIIKEVEASVKGGATGYVRASAAKLMAEIDAQWRRTEATRAHRKKEEDRREKEFKEMMRTWDSAGGGRIRPGTDEDPDADMSSLEDFNKKLRNFKAIKEAEKDLEELELEQEMLQT